VLTAILPSAVVVAETRADLPDAVLYADESAAVAAAVAERRREFARGRACARRALDGLGRPPVAIPTGARGEPRWPPGVVGSITHCAGYCAAAVAEAHLIRTLGIDAEPHEPLPDGVLTTIARAEEQRMVGRLLRDAPEIRWDRLLFSAKESVYKAWFPVARRWLGFEDATLTIDPAARTFTARFLVPGPELGGARLEGFSGRWRVADGLVVTAIAVEAGGAGGALRAPAA
jgi:4'-phosphopantetheinyl transferase EntD